MSSVVLLAVETEHTPKLNSSGCLYRIPEAQADSGIREEWA